jgi:hypothetical protein
MTKTLLMAGLLLLATPVFAQDVDLGLGGDVGALLNLPAPTASRGAPAGGATPPRGAAPNAPPVDRLVRLREMLAGAGIPLSAEQEASLNNVLNAEIPLMRRSLQARVLELQKAKGGVPPGAPPTVNLPGMEEITPLIVRLNDQLLVSGSGQVPRRIRQHPADARRCRRAVG